MDNRYPKPLSQTGFDEPPRIRPYLITSGRTKTATEPPPVETIISTVSEQAVGGLRFERRLIAQICLEPISVAELASQLDLPLHVVNLLVVDLITDGVLEAMDPTDHDIEFIELLISGIEAL